MANEAKSPNIATIPLKKVTLYKHGIGHFERRGKFKGPGEIELLCGPEDIDDMLKSLLVLNVEGGGLAAVTYDSAKTLPTRLSEFGFDLRKCHGLLELIAQIKGSPVTIKVGTTKVEGRVAGLDEVEQAVGDNKIVEQQLLLYCGGASLKRYGFSTITEITLNDPHLASEIQQQLELLFQSIRKKDRKLLKVELTEAIEREVVIAYSIPNPIWKTSYRMVVDDSGRVLLQGTAIVDNVQDEDWEEVHISLVSAAPVSFIQPLYDPVQPHRRRIQAQGHTASGPYVAERAHNFGDGFGGVGAEPASSTNSFELQLQERFKANKASDEFAAGAVSSAGSWRRLGPLPNQSREAEAVNVFDAAQLQNVEVEVSESGELFEYQISLPVTIPRNSSALIPIVNELIEGERISLYNAARNARFPYAALRLKNTTGLTLESGPVTILETNTYAGEALLDVLKNDDTRILPFALDQSVNVIVRDNFERKPFWRVRAWQGFLYLDYKEETQKTYNIENLSDQEKVVYVEHPVQSTLSLVSQEKPVEVTESFYRFRIPLKSKEAHSLCVVEEGQNYQTVRLEDFDSPDMAAVKWLMDQNFVDKQFHAFLKQVIEKRTVIRLLLEQRKTMHEHVAELKAEQERARENVRTLGTSSDRYRTAIDETEDKIVSGIAKLNELTGQITELRKDYIKFIGQTLQSDILTQSDAPTPAAAPSS
ncbi:MAG: hypothetical protein IT343_03270 [Candidatus Melainabacteria bacterium]|jgi:hypothetical protein|nr:hypothetical protein [Candidatus Melainabacteria bacterium]